MKTILVVPALLMAAAAISPAQANWFHNAKIGINRNVGSAPNPTPEDLREDRMPIVTENPDDATVAADAQPQQQQDAKAAEAAQPQVRTRTAEANGASNTAASPAR